MWSLGAWRDGHRGDLRKAEEVSINITDQNVNKLAHLRHRVDLIEIQSPVLQGVVVMRVVIMGATDE